MYTIALSSPAGAQLLHAPNRGKAFQQLMNWSGCTLQQATDVLDAADKGGSASCFTVTACTVHVKREAQAPKAHRNLMPATA